MELEIDGFQFRSCSLPGLMVVKPRVFGDERGWFQEPWREGPYKQAGVEVGAQDNNVFSNEPGTIRALHFQTRPGQNKLLWCLSGAVWDVAVDVRLGSLTFRQAFGIELSPENHLQLYVPIGFAHGYCVLKPNTIVAYKVSAPYDSACERGIRYNDPGITGLEWPTDSPKVLERDATAPLIDEFDWSQVAWQTQETAL